MVVCLLCMVWFDECLGCLLIWLIFTSGLVACELLGCLGCGVASFTCWGFVLWLCVCLFPACGLLYLDGLVGC